jgi:hypothetical protein
VRSQTNDGHKTYNDFLHLLNPFLVSHRDSKHVVHVVIVVVIFVILYHFNILDQLFFGATDSPLLVFSAIQTWIVVCGRYLLPGAFAFRLFLGLCLGALFFTSLREFKDVWRRRCRLGASLIWYSRVDGLIRGRGPQTTHAMGPQTYPAKLVLPRFLQQYCDAEIGDQKRRQTEAAAGPHC